MEKNNDSSQNCGKRLTDSAWEGTVLPPLLPVALAQGVRSGQAGHVVGVQRVGAPVWHLPVRGGWVYVGNKRDLDRTLTLEGGIPCCYLAQISSLRASGVNQQLHTRIIRSDLGDVDRVGLVIEAVASQIQDLQLG